MLGAATGLDMAEWLLFTSAKFLILSSSALLPNLYQIQLLGGVSESSGPDESKTVIEIQF